MHLQLPDGSVFDLFGALATVSEGTAEVQVAVDERIKAAVPLGPRLVIIRKSEADAARAQADMRRSASKRCKQLDPRSLEAAKYVLLLTSLPASDFSGAWVAALYRLRWQIELAFKRWKSLAGLDRLPAKDPALARSWIYARLIAALLAKKNHRTRAGVFPLRRRDRQVQLRPGGSWPSPGKSCAPPSSDPEDGGRSKPL